MTRARRWFLACLLWLPMQAAWPLYRVVGPHGGITFTDVPPASGAHQVQRLHLGATPAASRPALPQNLRALAARQPVVVYTMAACPGCRDGLALLRRRGVPYTELRVDNAAALARFEQRSHGVRRLPLLVVGQTQLEAGFNASAWQQALSAAGYPSQSQLPAHYRFAAPRPLLPASAPARPGAQHAAGPTLAPVQPPRDPHAPPGFQF